MVEWPTKRQVSLRRFCDFEALKADSYRYWREQPPHARLSAVAELNAELNALKGVAGNGPRLQRTVRLLKR